MMVFGEYRRIAVSGDREAVRNVYRTYAGLQRQPSSFGKEEAVIICSQKCLRLRESQRAPRNVVCLYGHIPLH